MRPTFAKQAEARVSRGGEVDITLEAIPDYGNTISFEIQSPPAHGVLSNLTNTSDHTAMVTYRHDGSKMPLSDEFQFRAQAPGRAKSSVTPVNITVIAPPVYLKIEPKELDFGSLFVGEIRKTNVTISNLGGIKANGRLILPSGYSVSKDGEYSLQEGERAKIDLEFSPVEEKDYTARADSLPQYAGTSLLLKGEGVSRFSISKKNPLACTVTNNTDQSLRLSFTGETAWIMPHQVELSPHEGREFSFKQAESEENLVLTTPSSDVQISDGSSTRIFQLPPVQGFIPLSLSTTAPTEFGNIALGSSLLVSFSIQNRSEMNKNIRWIAASSSGGGMISKTELLLMGGEVREIHYEWSPTLPGEASLKVTVEEGTKTSHELIWHATVVSSPLTEIHESQSTLELKQDNEENVQQFPSGMAQNIKIIPPLENLSWEEHKSWNGLKNVELRWEGEETDVSQVKILERVMRMKQKSEISNEEGAVPRLSFHVDDIPLKAFSVRKDGSQEVMEIQDLQPGWHLLVLSRVTKDGMSESKSQVRVFVTSPKPWWSLLRTPLLLLFLFLLAAFLWKQRS